ncbi:MAG: hydroxymethylbilane synthase, partial [Luteibaculum sp.]
MKRTFIIGTRGSDLAMWQAKHVQAQLEKQGISTEIKIISTQGDRVQDLPFDKMEGKGFFTKEIEAALIQEEIDIAVHSHKDLETTNPPGLCIAAVSERENPLDLLLIRKESCNPSANLKLKPGAVVGTSAARRISQLQRYIDFSQIKMLRGNVPTRIQKLREKQYDAILIAAAGVERLKIDLSEFEVLPLVPDVFVPAPAQGSLGLQCRENDKDCVKILGELNNSPNEQIVRLERGVLKELSGGCQVPLGVHAKKTASGFQVWLAYAS